MQDAAGTQQLFTCCPRSGSTIILQLFYSFTICSILLLVLHCTHGKIQLDSMHNKAYHCIWVHIKKNDTEENGLFHNTCCSVAGTRCAITSWGTLVETFFTCIRLGGGGMALVYVPWLSRSEYIDACLSFSLFVETTDLCNGSSLLRKTKYMLNRR